MHLVEFLFIHSTGHLNVFDTKRLSERRTISVTEDLSAKTQRFRNPSGLWPASPSNSTLLSAKPRGISGNSQVAHISYVFRLKKKETTSHTIALQKKLKMQPVIMMTFFIWVTFFFKVKNSGSIGIHICQFSGFQLNPSLLPFNPA